MEPVSEYSCYTHPQTRRYSPIDPDVEGAEGLVFKGALNTIRTHKPWVIVEFNRDLMSENEVKLYWKLMTESAKEIVYLKGTEARYSLGDVIDKEETPANNTFNMYIRY